MKYGRKTLAGVMIAVLLLGGMLFSGCGKKEAKVADAPIRTVETAVAEKMTIAESANYTGTLQGKDEVNIMAKLPGKVTHVYVEVGDKVRAGQTLMQLDTTDVEAQVKQAEAALQAALAAQKANAVQAENARINLERMEQLFAQGVISQQQLDQARAQYEGLTAGTAEAGVAQAEAALAAARNQLDNCTITSPISGVVGNLYISEGEMAGTQQPVAIVTNIQQMEIEVKVTGDDITYLREGDSAEVYIKAAADKPLKGKISSIGPVADQRSKTFPVKIALEQTEGALLKSGMFARVKLTVRQKQGVIGVPVDAVLEKGARRVVFTVDENNRVHEIEVIPGIISDTHVEIIEGLNEGDQVVVKGQTFLHEGDEVQIMTGGDKQ